MEKGRRVLDFYETPPHYIKALFDVIGQPTGTVYECCVGKGQIARRFRDARRIITNDINPKLDADTHLDATRYSSWWKIKADWVITNPPFSDAFSILDCALNCDGVTNVAMLVRLSFLEPTYERAPLWEKHDQRCTVIVLPRYSFRNNDDGKKQTDSVTCCWLVFWSAQRRGHLHVSQRRLAK